MNISKKIEEIRKQPEHIRIRYVWAGVIIAMILIVIVWIFSIRDAFKSLGPAEEKNIQSIQEQLDKSKIDKPSIEEFMKEQNQDNTTNNFLPNKAGNINKGQ